MANEIEPVALEWCESRANCFGATSRKNGQTYIIYNNEASLYNLVDGEMTVEVIYEGDRPREFCEVHNLQWGE